MPRNTRITIGHIGTPHHCPGAKISKYVKMGNCSYDKKRGYCTRHQVPCEDPECNWSRPSQEPCGGCIQRGKVIVFCPVRSRVRVTEGFSRVDKPRKIGTIIASRDPEKFTPFASQLRGRRSDHALGLALSPPTKLPKCILCWCERYPHVRSGITGLQLDLHTSIFRLAACLRYWIGYSVFCRRQCRNRSVKRVPFHRPLDTRPHDRHCCVKY